MTPFGYLLVHFVEDPEGHGEQAYFSLSEGDDPAAWTRLHGGRPVLSSALGTTGVRDPHLVRGGDGFHLVATDLRVWGAGPHRWDEWTRTGSRSLVVWRSDDLVTWSAPWLAEVVGPEAGMAWAPESRWDPQRGEYAVSWSSAVYAADDPDHRGAGFSRILTARTRDFRTFSSPEVLLDRGRAVIDARVYEIDGRTVRFAKEEDDAPDSLGVFQEVETSSGGYEVVASRIGADRFSRVEAPTLVEDRARGRWLLLVDQYERMPQGYIAYATDDPFSGRWTAVEDFRIPPNTKHGSVLPLLGDEHQRLRDAFG